MDLYWLILLAVPAFVLMGGVALVKTLAQASRDGSRQHYIITFPRDVKFDSVMNLMTSIAGLTTRPFARLGGLLTVGLEVEADNRGIRHRLILPAGKPAAYMVGQVRQYGFHIVREEVDHDEKWDEVVEFRLKGEAPLRMNSPEDVVSSILAALGPLKDEAILLQWIVAPARHKAWDESDARQKEKHAYPLFQAVGRVAVRAETPKERHNLIWRVASALKSVEMRGAKFVQPVSHGRLIHHQLVHRLGGLNFHTLLNGKELAALSTLPSGNPQIPGLPQGKTRTLAADSRIPDTGFTIAMSDFAGAERPLAVSLEDRMKHMHIVGPTGSGKSYAMEHVILQEIDQGYGTIVIEPGTDLVNRLLERIPPERVKDVIVFDVTDGANMPIGFNPLSGKNPHLVTQQVMGVLDSAWDIKGLFQTSDVLRSGILTLVYKKLTLMDLSLLLETGERGKDFRYETMKGIDDPVLKNFWREFDAKKPSDQINTVAPVTRRLRQLEYWPTLRAMLGQKKSGFEMEDVIANHKILLVPLNQALIGEEITPMIGGMLVSKLWNAVTARSAMKEEARVPVFCHIDEVQQFLHTPVSIRHMLSQARKLNLSLNIAHQDLNQLPPQHRDGIMGDARSKIIFAPGSSSDASAWSRELSPHLQPHEFQNLSRYQVVVRVAVGGEMAPPATGTTYGPSPAISSVEAVREASRSTYGTPLAQVEAEMAARHKLTFEPKPDPNIGREEKPVSDS